jgi:GxxExxY protein
MPRHNKGWLKEEELTHSAIGAFYAVHNTLGFGFLESIYARALQVELEYRGHRVVREYPVDIIYRGVDIGRHRLDLVVDDKLVLETKATEQLPRDFARQLYNYLKASQFEVGLFLHFGRSADFYRIVLSNDEKGRRDRPGGRPYEKW